MKKLQIILTFAAFTLAIAGAVASDDTYPNYGIFGAHPMGYCVEAEDFDQSGCGTSGIYQCTVWLEEIGGSAYAYQLQISQYECGGVYSRWRQ